MARKVIRSLSFPIMALALVFSLLSFEGKANAASPTSSPIQVVEKSNQGEKILNFSSPQQVKEFSSKTDVGIMSGGSEYFYEHIYLGGSFTTLYSGLSTYDTGIYWGSFWNDRISSVSVAPGTWVMLYQHNNYNKYGGYSILLRNNTSIRYSWNLTNYRMGDGTSWNDRVSSIKTGSY